MSQSLSKIYVHLVFGTKHRFPFITDKIRPELHLCMNEIIRNFGSRVIAINSVLDHVHILLELPKTSTISYIVKDLKISTSKFLKTLNTSLSNFAWQDGYGAFSVSSSKVDVVKNYIQNQHTHHQNTNFKDEIEMFVSHYDITEYKNEYFWS